MWVQSREKFEDVDIEDWSDTVTSQGMPAVTKIWKRQEADFSFETPERV